MTAMQELFSEFIEILVGLVLGMKYHDLKHTAFSHEN